MDHESLIPLLPLTSSLVPADKVQFMARPSQRRGNLLYPDVPGIVSVPNLADSHSTDPQNRSASQWLAHKMLNFPHDENSGALHRRTSQECGTQSARSHGRRRTGSESGSSARTL